MSTAESYQSEAASTALMESLMTGKGCVRAIAAVGGIELAVQAMINSPMNAKIQTKGCQALYCLANHQDPPEPGEMPNDYRKMVIDAQGLVVLSEAIRLHGSNEEVYFAAIKAISVLLPDLERCTAKQRNGGGCKNAAGDGGNDDDDISSISQSKSSQELEDSLISSSFFSYVSNTASRTSTDVSEQTEYSSSGDETGPTSRRRINQLLNMVRWLILVLLLNDFLMTSYFVGLLALRLSSDLLDFAYVSLTSLPPMTTFLVPGLHASPV
jgi:hypothetical protein